jgi:gibberellin 2beta-dioxygenase
MVVPSTTPVVRQETPPPSHDGIGIPTVDLSAPGGRGALSRQVARACAQHGFFRAVNHGVAPGPAARLDAAARTFFALAPHNKQRAGPPSPLGYGCRSIGFNGDAGELEYLLLHANPAAVAHRARSIDTDDPSRFRYNKYTATIRTLTTLVCSTLPLDYICIHACVHLCAKITHVFKLMHAVLLANKILATSIYIHP